LWNAEFGLRIEGDVGSVFQSAFRNPKSALLWAEDKPCPTIFFFGTSLFCPALFFSSWKDAAGGASGVHVDRLDRTLLE
jgi:hypothetical protein